MKKLFCILACICVLTALCVMSASAETVTGECGNDATWVLDTETGVLTISGTGDMWDYYYSDDDEDLPGWTDYSSLKTVIIEDGITHIGKYAFYHCENITSITIPDSVTSIGNFAFRYCTGLENTVGNLVYIKTAANPYFYLSDTTSTTITSCNINSKTRFIGNHAFASCNNLTNITIPNGVTSINYSAFSGCSSLKSITIPDSVAIIDEFAFYNCSSLTNITIPNSVTSINNSVFRNCTGLTSITIPDSVTKIDYHAFDGCNSLKNTVGNLIYIKTTENPYFYLSDTTSTEITSCNISIRTRFIGDYAFYNCSSLTSVAIPDSVTSIGNYAFYSCSALTSATISYSVTSIGGSAFSRCSNLTIYGMLGSYAQSYSNSNNIPFTCSSHFFSQWVETKQSTCEEVGSKRRCCSCGAEETAAIPMLGHDYINHDAKTANCTDNGWNAYETCSRCNYTTYVEIPALGHSFEETVVTKPTASTSGELKCTCTVCGHTEYKEIVPGDINFDGVTTVGDAILILDAVLSGTATEKEDINGDGKVNLIDILSIIAKLVE